MRSEDARSKSESEASAADPAAESTGGKEPADIGTAPALRGGADADDLASLGSGLPSLRPGEADDAEGEDTLDLGRLVAAATRTVGREPAAGEDAADAAFSTAPGLESALGVTASSLVPPRQRPSWVVPMLGGVGLGVVIAGAAFGLAAGRVPAASNSPDSPALAAQHEVPPVAVAAVPPTPPTQDPAQVPDQANAVAAPSTALQPAAAPASEVSADSALHAPSRPLANAPAVAVAPRRPASAEPSAAAPAPAPAAPAEERTSLLKPKEPASIEELAEAADPGAAKQVQGETENGAKSPSRVDQMLDEALAPDAQRAAVRQKQALALAAAELPATPSRDEVTKAMTVLLPAIRGCAMGQTGLMTAGIIVHNDGRVASVDITGAPFANTASGRCMEGVMRRAQFPRFRQAIFRIKFPFAIQ